MNWAWWDGKMPVEHYRHEHALDADAMAKAEATDKSRNDARNSSHDKDAM
jgi:hypothetical protein